MTGATDPKAALRSSTLAARRSLEPVARTAASAAIVDRLLRLPAVARSTTVLLYAPQPDEVDPSELVLHLRERGARTLFPRVREDHLELAVVTDLRDLTLGFRGISEPVGPAIDPGVVDAAIVPGVAFDLAGTRLGHGGGHYDRLLPQLSRGCARIGLAFSVQIVPRVPREEHDAVVDLVVTERATHRTGGRLRADEPDGTL